MGEHFLFTLLMTLVLLGAFTIISLVMLWAPSTPFPMKNEPTPVPVEEVEETD